MLQGTQEEREGIIRTLDLYVDSARKGDSKIAVQAFADVATMAWAENGKLECVPISNLFAIIDSKGPSEASYELTFLAVEKDAAIARIESQFGTRKFADMFSLVKERSNWKIISKVYHLK